MKTCQPRTQLRNPGTAHIQAFLLQDGVKCPYCFRRGRWPHRGKKEIGVNPEMAEKVEKGRKEKAEKVFQREFHRWPPAPGRKKNLFDNT